MATNNGYATAQQLAEIIGIKESIPSWAPGSTPSNEEVGTGDESATIFYLDNRNVLASSYTLYYGETSATTTQLVETTDYALELGTGKITLTAGGVTKLGTNKIFAAYSYVANGMSSSFLEETLNRAEAEVNKRINSVFTDGTATNPAYPSEIESQYSPGYFLDMIIANKKPLIDLTSTLNGDVAVDAIAIDLAAGTGSIFPSSGYLVIGSEIISYTGISTDQLTGVSRGVLGSTASTHSDGDAVHSTILLLSSTQQGSAASFVVQPWDSSMYADENGLFFRYKDAQVYSTSDAMINQDVANRAKLIYYYGYDTIPADITRLTLLFAKRQLLQDNISKALIAGRDEFQPEMFNVDNQEIMSIIDSYIVLSMGNI